MVVILSFYFAIPSSCFVILNEVKNLSLNNRVRQRRDLSLRSG